MGRENSWEFRPKSISRDHIKVYRYRGKNSARKVVYIFFRKISTSKALKKGFLLLTSTFFLTILVKNRYAGHPSGNENSLFAEI